MGLERYRDSAEREGTSERMGSIDRGTGRARLGTLAAIYFRPPLPALADSFFCSAQGTVLGSVAADFLLFSPFRARAKKSAIYSMTVSLASAVSRRWESFGAFVYREER
jgi:hypothetical protein